MKKTEKDNVFHYATVLFMLVSLICFISSLIYLENDETTIGFVMLGFAVAMLGVTIWTYFHPFYPVLLGLALYLALVGLLFKGFPSLMENTFGRRFLIYLLAAMGLILYALFIGFKEWREKAKR